MHGDSPRDQEWESFKRRLGDRAGISLDGYRREQLERRLRAAAARASGSDRSWPLLDWSGGDLARLRAALTINVSELFRSPDRFEWLRREVLPSLLSERSQLRVWSAGCSYGAEIWSVALLLEELTPGLTHHLLATDVDEAILARARTSALFSLQEIRHVPRRLLARYFEEAPNERWRLSEQIRSRCQFRRHDLLTEPYGGAYDLIVCRNVLIYFTPEAQRRVAAGLHTALRSGGYLFGGSVEASGTLIEAGFERTAVGFYRKELKGER